VYCGGWWDGRGGVWTAQKRSADQQSELEAADDRENVGREANGWPAKLVESSAFLTCSTMGGFEAATALGMTCGPKSLAVTSLWPDASSRAHFSFLQQLQSRSL